MKAIAAYVSAIALTAACESRRPTPTAPDPNPGPAATHTLFGVVRAGGVPVGGATVAVRDVNGYFEDNNYPTPPREVLTTTDRDGYYILPDVPVSLSSPFGSMVRASKPGYFTDFKGPCCSQDTRFDFDLEPWVHIALDEVIRGQVGGAICAGLSGWVAGPCQRFAVTVRAPAILELTAPVFNFELAVVTPDGKFAVSYSAPAPSTPLQVRIPVSAGTYEINVVGTSQTRDFVLTTALR